MTKTSATILIIVAVVVSAAIVAFSAYQKTIMDWFASLAMKSIPENNNQSQRVSQNKTYNINDVADSLARGAYNLQ